MIYDDRERLREGIEEAIDLLSTPGGAGEALAVLTALADWLERRKSLERQSPPRIVADISLYAKGYQDAFAEVTSRIEALFVVWANEPIPARIDGSGCAQ